MINTINITALINTICIVLVIYIVSIKHTMLLVWENYLIKSTHYISVSCDACIESILTQILVYELLVGFISKSLILY